MHARTVEDMVIIRETNCNSSEHSRESNRARFLVEPEKCGSFDVYKVPTVSILGDNTSPLNYPAKLNRFQVCNLLPEAMILLLALSLIALCYSAHARKWNNTKTGSIIFEEAVSLPNLRPNA